MPTEFGELKRLVFLEIKRSDGEAELAIEEAINRALKCIARIQNFEELFVLDTTNASTQASMSTVVNTIGNLGAVFSGVYDQGPLKNTKFTITCDGNGNPDTFKWQVGTGPWTAGVPMSEDPITLQNGVIVQFAALTGHTIGNSSYVTCNGNIYHLINDLSLTRPKDIISIRLIDQANSRKLVWVPIRDYDAVIPYPQAVGTARSKWYVQRGMYLELYPVPDDVYPLWIQYTQWPSPLVEDTDQTPYLNLDDVTTTLAAEIAMSILQGGSMTGWDARAKEILGQELGAERLRPDAIYIARPFRAGKTRITGEYWLDPFIKEVNQ